jgi:hypothetical protein
VSAKVSAHLWRQLSSPPTKCVRRSRSQWRHLPAPRPA